MTRTVYQLDDLGGVLSWSSLHSFIKYLDSQSATARELDKSTGWESALKTNGILADIYDLLQVVNANLVVANGGKKKTIKPYPRPGRDEDKNNKRIGKDAVPIDDLREWIRRKQENG